MIQDGRDTDAAFDWKDILKTCIPWNAPDKSHSAALGSSSMSIIAKSKFYGSLKLEALEDVASEYFICVAASH